MPAMPSNAASDAWKPRSKKYVALAPAKNPITMYEAIARARRVRLRSASKCWFDREILKLWNQATLTNGTLDFGKRTSC